VRAPIQRATNTEHRVSGRAVRRPGANGRPRAGTSEEPRERGYGEGGAGTDQPADAAPPCTITPEPPQRDEPPTTSASNRFTTHATLSTPPAPL
jgi:hypothetical protein